MYIIYTISNSYNFANKEKTMQTASANKIFRTISAESAKNRKPATLRQRAFSATD